MAAKTPVTPPENPKPPNNTERQQNFDLSSGCDTLASAVNFNRRTRMKLQEVEDALASLNTQQRLALQHLWLLKTDQSLRHYFVNMGAKTFIPPIEVTFEGEYAHMKPDIPALLQTIKRLASNQQPMHATTLFLETNTKRKYFTQQGKVIFMYRKKINQIFKRLGFTRKALYDRGYKGPCWVAPLDHAYIDEFIRNFDKTGVVG